MGVGLIALMMSVVNPLWGLLGAMFGLLMYWRWPWQGLLILIGISFGVAWMSWHIDQQFAKQLPIVVFQRPMMLTGRVVSIPQFKWGEVSFEFKTSFSSLNSSLSSSRTGGARHVYLKLDSRIRKDESKKSGNSSNKNENKNKHSGDSKRINLGDRWQFMVQLKAPVDRTYSDGFNQARWLFSHHISATGHILKSQRNQMLKRSRWYDPVDQVRHYLFIKMYQSLKGEPLTDLLIALTIGDRSEMTQAQWKVLQRTGTAHLMAIAGLHIGLVAGMAFFLVSFFWRLSKKLMLFTPNVIAATVSAWFFALIYSALAGFALPTQRAMIMLTCFSFSIIYRRVLAPWQAYFTALMLILLLEPFDVLSISFWMSFVVVGLIIYALTRKQRKNKIYELIRLQLIVALAVIPLSLYFFHQAAWLSPFLNAVAIPWVGFIVIPLSLLACLFVGWLPNVAHDLWWMALKNLQGVWHVLDFFSGWRMSVWLHAINFVQFIFLLLVVIFLLAFI